MPRHRHQHHCQGASTAGCITVSRRRPLPNAAPRHLDLTQASQLLTLGHQLHPGLRRQTAAPRMRRQRGRQCHTDHSKHWHTRRSRQWHTRRRRQWHTRRSRHPYRPMLSTAHRHWLNLQSPKRVTTSVSYSGMQQAVPGTLQESLSRRLGRTDLIHTCPRHRLAGYTGLTHTRRPVPHKSSKRSRHGT